MIWLRNGVSFKIIFSTQEYLTANPAKEEDPEEEIEEIEEIEEEEEEEEVDHEAELKDVQPANKELESVLKFFHPECNATCIVLKMSVVNKVQNGLKKAKRSPKKAQKGLKMA